MSHSVCEGRVAVQSFRNDYLSLPRRLRKHDVLLYGDSGFEEPWLGAVNESRTIAVLNTGAHVFPAEKAVEHMRPCESSLQSCSITQACACGVA